MAEHEQQDDMPENDGEDGASEERGARRGLFGGRSTWLQALLAIPVLIVIALVGAAIWLDSESGHDFIERQIAALEPANGLRISVGDIKGSIYSSAVIEDLRVADPEGVFFSAPQVDLDWFPFSFLSNRLSIDRLGVDKAQLRRLPKFIDTGKDGPLLPSFDILIDELHIGALDIGKSVVGRPVTLSLDGNADIRDGRAVVALAGQSTAGDRFDIDLDAEPDGDRFDIAVDMASPDDGVIPALAGFSDGFGLEVAGEGTWTDWEGGLVATYDGRRAADLDLSLADGKWRAKGQIDRPGFLQGAVAGLVGETTRIDLSGTYEDRLIELAGNISGSNLELDLDGGIDLAANRFDRFQLLIGRLDVNAVLPDARADGFSGRIWLDGPFNAMEIDYVASARRFFIGDTGFENLMLSGEGVALGDGVRIPVDLRATQVVGTGEIAEQALSNLVVEGALILDGSRLSSDGLVLTTDQIDSRIDVAADLDSGDYDVAFDGRIRDFNIRGFGQVDLVADIGIRPDAAGNLTLSGRAQADMDRLDIGFLKTIAGGLPRLDTEISFGADKRFRFSNFTLRSPKFRFRGSGVRKTDGTFDISGQGIHSDYGPLEMTLMGEIDRPRVALNLESPLPAAGLTDVELLLDPTPEGFAVTSNGQSLLGPYDMKGALLLPEGRDAALRVDALELAGSTATGTLVFAENGAVGDLTLSGGALAGDIVLDTEGAAQIVRADIAVSELATTGGNSLSIRKGKLDVTARLESGNSDIDGTFEAAGVRGYGLAFGRVSADADISNGAGQVALSLAGTRGSSFEFDALASIAPESIEVVGEGSFRNRPIVLSRPIRLQNDDGVWELLPSELRYGGGSLLVGGRLGEGSTLAALEFDKFPLLFFDLGDSNLGLSGTISGVASYADTDGVPTGEVQLQLRDFARSGLYLTSEPVDFGVNARLDKTELGLRAVVEDDGANVGRVQAHIDGIPRGGALYDRLSAGRLAAQLRYDGPAEALWRLAGVELFDLKGKVAIGADADGSLAAPRVEGAIAADNARLESAATGTVIKGLSMRGTFDGSRLTLSRFEGRTNRDGRISGGGEILLGGEHGFSIDLSMQAKRALLLDRDDFSAQVTGPLTIKSDDSGGGTIGGDFTLDWATFDLGNVSSSVELPQVRVYEVNTPADRPDAQAASSPWTLDVQADANNQVYVSGMGLDSEWRANLAINGPVDAFRLLGEANLIRGEFEFAGKTFELERGEIGFLGGSEINPTLDIAANAEVEGIDATVTVSGRGQSPQIAFSSNPAMPQEELLSRILFGASVTELSAAEALQLGAAVASLQGGGGGGLDPINAVRQAAGLDRLRIVGGDEQQGIGTAIAAGKYITDDVYAELVTDGQGYSATQVEYQITRWLSILSSISTLGRQQVSVRASKDY